MDAQTKGPEEHPVGLPWLSHALMIERNPPPLAWSDEALYLRTHLSDPRHIVVTVTRANLQAAPPRPPFQARCKEGTLHFYLSNHSLQSALEEVPGERRCAPLGPCGRLAQGPYPGPQRGHTALTRIHTATVNPWRWPVARLVHCRSICLNPP